MAGRSGPRGSYAKSAEQRRRILDASMEVFARLGGRGSSLREIAERVGMSQAGVLHHFGSKNALLMAVLARRDDDSSHVAAEPEPETVADYVAQTRELLARGYDRPGLLQLFVTLSAEATDPEHPAHEFFVERYARVAEQFSAPLEAAARDGQVRDDVDPKALAHLVIAAMDGLQLQKLLNDDVDVLKSYDLLTEALFATYAGAPGMAS